MAAEGAQIVVKTANGIATIITGGNFLGANDGESMTCEELTKRTPIGVRCAYNPSGFLRLGMIKGAANRARQ